MIHQTSLLLKLMDQLAFDIARAREDQYVSHIANNSNNHCRLLMAQAYHHLAWGLTQLASYVQAEPPAQFRYCRTAVIVELVSFIATIFQHTALNLHDPAQRWRQNVELWIARDQWKPYGQTQYALTVRNHTGALKRTGKVPAPNGAGFQRIHDDEAEPVFTQAQHSDF